VTLSIPPDAVVVLDIDDTLYLERSYVRSGFDAVGHWLTTRLGVTGAAERLWSGFEAGIRGNAFNQVLASYGIDPDEELVAELIACYRGHRPAIELLADAERFLARLGGRATAAITDGPAESQWAKVAALGLETRLDRVVVTAELGPGHAKPDPLAYRLIEEELGASGTCCWYIADNPAKDFVTPLARGWSPVRVRRAESLHYRQDTPPGVVEITSLDPLRC
jgi:putative hydrolase of the HAD superfamily